MTTTPRTSARRQCDGCPRFIDPARLAEHSDHPKLVFHSQHCAADYAHDMRPQPLTPGSRPLVAERMGP